MTADEKAEESRARAAGTRNRQAFIDSLLDLITDPRPIRTYFARLELVGCSSQRVGS